MRVETVGNAMIHTGDCIGSMRAIPSGSVNTCVTSPPYFGLRDYGADGQIGLEATPDEYIAKLVDVFREVRRVLRDDGTLWLNIGDSYAANRGHQVPSTLMNGDATNQAQSASGRGQKASDYGLKPKDLIGIPWMLAFALRTDGWYLRQDIIWHKPNPMPESVTDRCTKAHEYVFLLSKSERYHYDHDAIKEVAIYGDSGRESKKRGEFNGKGQPEGREPFRAITEYRNKRSVWTVSTKPFSGAHFAVFPPELIIPCVLAGCPVGGTVLDPFGGSGTTGIVAVENGRQAILCEINPDYAAMAAERIAEAQRQERLFA